MKELLCESELKYGLLFWGMMGLGGVGRTWIVSGWVAIGGAGGMTYKGAILEGARLYMLGFDG